MGLKRTVLLVALLAMSLAGQAQAAELKMVGNALTWTSEDVIDNQLVIDYGQNLCPVDVECPPYYTFRDTAEGMTVSAAGCSPSGDVAAGTTVTCDASAAHPVTEVAVFMNDGNDVLQTDPCASALCGFDPEIPVLMTVYGGDGHDTLSGGASPDLIYGQDGDDSLFGKGGGDDLNGGDDSGSDNLYGGSGRDDLIANDGSDLLVGGTGDDGMLDGGDGIDFVSYDDGRTHGVHVTLNGTAREDDGGPEDGHAGHREAVVNVEKIIGSRKSDVLVGNAQEDVISGLAGNDLIRGRGGNDRLSGGSGRDLLDGGWGADDLDGGTGIDTAVFSGHGVVVSLGGMQGSATGQGSDTLLVENVVGTKFRDVLRGNDSANVLDGRGGNDSIYGFAGKDLLRGGSGRDLCAGGAGNDRAADCERLRSIP